MRGSSGCRRTARRSRRLAAAGVRTAHRFADDAGIADDKDAADGKRGADDFGFVDDAAQDAEETAAEIFSSEILTDVQEETVLG